MRIAIFSDNFYPELSGISDSIITLGKELARTGHQINFYVPNYSRDNYHRAHLSEEDPSWGENIQVYRFSSLPFRTPTHQARMVIPWPVASDHIRDFKPDVIHTQLFFGVGLNALVAAKELNVPLIGTNHTAITEFVRHSPIKGEWFRNLSLKYVSWYYNKCGLVTAPSRSVLDEMYKNGFHRRAQVISNPIDTETFSPVHPEEKQRLKQSLGFSGHTIFFAGRLAPEKDIDVVIKALPLVLKEIPDAILAIAGNGISESLSDLATQLQVRAHVKFLGMLDKPSLANAYRASDMFVIMSTSDTQSLTLMDAMASGIPVLGARARGLPEYINDQNGFLIEPGDHVGLAEKIIWLFQNPDSMERLGRGGHEYVQQFSVANIAKRWLDIYQHAER